MKTYFSCTLLSDLVLTSRSATEGFHPSLDYIPGSKFLGIAAKMYSTEADKIEETLDIFHRGKVKFGNAYPVSENEILYPMPYAWFRDKQKEKEEIYLHHKITKENRKKDFVGVQLKQQREGFINAKGDKLCEIKQNFSIKSAYDDDLRKSEDEKMYGYFALPKGGQYVFCLDIDEQIANVDNLINQLIGKRHIGRSRSAEYGLVEIKKLASPPTTLQNNIDTSSETVVVYAASDLCFFDDNGFSTLDLSPKAFGFSEESTIKYDLSQIKTRVYQSYNGYRQSSNADYSVIEKGSVIVFSGKIAGKPQEYVGSLLSEGFGQIIYNPSFLTAEGFSKALPQEVENLTKVDKVELCDDLDSDKRIKKMLSRRVHLKKADKKIEYAAEEFSENNIAVFNGISNSQWGAIAGIAKSTPDKEALKTKLFDKDLGFLCRGVAQDSWRDKKVKLEDFICKEEYADDLQELLVKIASKMQKKNAKNAK